MEISRITEKNEEYFEHVLNGTAAKASANMLRIGVVDDEGRAVGALSAYADAEFIDITSIYVLEEYRKKGFGKALIDTLTELAGDDYTSIMVFVYEDEDTERFLEEAGFEFFDSTELHFIRLGEVLRSEKCRRLLLNNDTDELMNISGLDSTQKKVFTNFLKENNMPERGGYDPYWSTIRFEGNEVADLMLVEPVEYGVNMIWQHLDKKDVKKITLHMTELIRKMEEEAEFSPLARLNFASDNTRFLEVLAQLTGSTAHINPAGKYKRGIKLL